MADLTLPLDHHRLQQQWHANTAHSIIRQYAKGYESEHNTINTGMPSHDARSVGKEQANTHEGEHISIPQCPMSFPAHGDPPAERAGATADAAWLGDRAVLRTYAIGRATAGGASVTASTAAAGDAVKGVSPPPCPGGAAGVPTDAPLVADGGPLNDEVVVDAGGSAREGAPSNGETMARRGGRNVGDTSSVAPPALVGAGAGWVVASSFCCSSTSGRYQHTHGEQAMQRVESSLSGCTGTVLG
jgi:hypothetical protein